MALQVERTRELGDAHDPRPRPAAAVGPRLSSRRASWARWPACSRCPSGWLLAVILVDVINVRSFGWTMRLEADPWLFAQAFARQRGRGACWPRSTRCCGCSG